MQLNPRRLTFQNVQKCLMLALQQQQAGKVLYSQWSSTAQPVYNTHSIDFPCVHWWTLSHKKRQKEK